jgi:hypothetical protein
MKEQACDINIILLVEINIGIAQLQIYRAYPIIGWSM